MELELEVGVEPEVRIMGVEPEVAMEPGVRGGVVTWVGLITSGLGLQKKIKCGLIGKVFPEVNHTGKSIVGLTL